MKLAVSILQIKNINDLKVIDNLDFDYLHLDIMDGLFVPNKTWEYDEISSFVKDTKTKLDVHLMVNDIDSYIDDFKNLNPEFITFHYEATNDPMKYIKKIKDLGIKVGMSIKPNTSVEEIKDFLPLLDLVLVMSVEPGFGGQKFMDSAISKVNELNALKGDYVVEIDGGINDETIKFVNPDIAVVGSFITNGDYKENKEKLKRVI